MTDQKVLVFGSFTEDEIKSFQRQPPEIDIEIKFGSLDAETLRSVGIFNSKLTEAEYSKRWPSKLVNKENAVKVCTTESISQVIATTVEENGSINDTCLVSCSDCIEELETDNVELSVSSASENVSDLLKQNSTEHYVSKGVTKSSTLLTNEALVDSSVGVDLINSEESIPKASNGLGATVRNLLPRGLVNLGNLCFLNATLQALLSCPPFVLLLQELRNRDIQKIGYPTLHAFVEFVSDFDTPIESSSKKKEMLLETGRPFRPVMFESILQKFTPEVPNSISGRHRQEDAQEFLSFVMHQMHDELLKLEGQVPSSNGGSASLVSSINDEDDSDEWETVGPKNRTAITRTQSFIPSKLSAIFGGQLRSVVKAKGGSSSVDSLSWDLRLKIAIGAARDLSFLHTSESRSFTGTSKRLIYCLMGFWLRKFGHLRWKLTCNNSNYGHIWLCCSRIHCNRSNLRAIGNFDFEVSKLYRLHHLHRRWKQGPSSTKIQ